MRFYTTVHLLLLAYVIAALVFWGISLHRQSELIYSHQLTLLHKDVDSAQQPAVFSQRLNTIQKKRTARTKQYLGEGSTFLLVILIGAAIVYTSFRRRLSLSKQQNNFMLSVTHELKSPLAAMKLNLQTLAKHTLNETQRHTLLQRSITEADRLNELCNNMLIASQIEGRQYRAAREPLSLSRLVENSVEDYAQRYQGRMYSEVQTGCYVRGDELLLQMAFNNLLENAIKYAPADSIVSVNLFTQKNKAVLQVADEGPGIADREKKAVFNKFYRLGDENTRRTKGTGLGLYLAKKIARQHRGKISLRNNRPVGSVFEITLPLSSA